MRNTSRPHTVGELIATLEHARTDADISCVLLTSSRPSPKDGGWAFCPGGDQRVRGRAGYQYADSETTSTVDKAKLAWLHILEVRRLIRFMPKVVVAPVNGQVVGSGHSLYAVSDLTVVSREHAHFKQTDANVGSFDGGFDSAYLTRQMRQKFARQVFLPGDIHDAQETHETGMVNKVVPYEELEETGLKWAVGICRKSPATQWMPKYSFNLVDDGLAGQQVLLGETTRLAYTTDEMVEGHDSFLECHTPDWSGFPYYY